MKKSEFLRILRKYNNSNASEEEKDFLFAYYDLFEGEPEVVGLLENDEKDRLKKQIKATIDKKIQTSPDKRLTKIYSIFRPMAAAAILLVMIGAGAIWYFAGGKLSLEQRYAGNKLPPGGNKAVLTLANGSRIVLNNANNGQIAIQGGTRITKSAAGEVIYNASATTGGVDTVYNTLTTPKGGQYMVVLPDSSKVYLNAASSLRFPAVFSGKTRTVMLTGEAYFEVAHDRTKPFHVISRGQTVEVLGTHFNINAYDDEKYISTTLLEGRVKISSGKSTAILSPGDQAHTFTDQNTGVAVLKDANSDAAIAWKNGLFDFENADIKTIMRQYARWYNVNIVYEGKISNRLFSGEIHRDLNAANALDLLGYANVHFNIDGKTIIVSP